MDMSENEIHHSTHTHTKKGSLIQFNHIAKTTDNHPWDFSDKSAGHRVILG
jgi:hypothetical protein